MLHFDTIDPRTLDLLRRLMREPALSEFYLVGGTPLALHLGHRLSVDLDLFRDDGFDPVPIIAALESWPGFGLVRESRNSLTVSQMSVKIDLIAHQYPRLRPVRHSDGVRLLEMEDIVPMKLSAVSRRGSRKDFYDIAALLQHFTLPQMLERFGAQYGTSEPFMIIRSLVFFDDAEEEGEVISLDGTSWEAVKAKLSQAVASL